MSTQTEKDLIDYMRDNFSADEQRQILEHLYSMGDYLLKMGSAGVLVANMLAQKMNQHALEQNNVVIPHSIH